MSRYFKRKMMRILWKKWGFQMAVCQNLVPLVNIIIAGKWMFIPLKMVLIGIDPYPDGLSRIGQEHRRLAAVGQNRHLSRKLRHPGRE